MKPLKRESKNVLTERVLQFGEGNFLRAFADWMIDKLNTEHNFDCGVVVVQPIETGLIDKLNEQDGLYSLFLRGIQNGGTVQEKRIVQCITRGIDPYANWTDYMGCAKNPSLRFIVSNTTESGIEYKANEQPQDAPYITFPAKLTLFLKARFDLGLNGFIIIPCELIDQNGDNLKKCIMQYARDWNFGDDFINWIESENHFTNTLVDRIVTGYPKEEAPLLEKELGFNDELMDTAEIFHLWVIEGDKKLSEELPFHEIGLNVIWTDDATPYKKRKVRILNGAHTMTVLAARLAGLETVKECMDDKDIYSFMKKGIFEEIIPSLENSGMAKEELEQFANDVLIRFANPFINHYLLSIALNSVSKFKVRVLPSIQEYIKLKNKLPENLILSLASLIEFYKTDEANDLPEILDFMKTASVEEILKNTEIWGDDLTFLIDKVKEYLIKIKEKGIREVMKCLL